MLLLFKTQGNNFNRCCFKYQNVLFYFYLTIKNIKAKIVILLSNSLEGSWLKVWYKKGSVDKNSLGTIILIGENCYSHPHSLIIQ